MTRWRRGELSRRQVLAGAAAGTAVLAAPWPASLAARASAARASCLGTGGASGRLEIVGNTLTAAGVAQRLLGVAVGDPIYVRAKRGLGDYGLVADAWNANTVRISLHPGHWRADRGEALRRLDADVRAARGAGLRVIIVWQAIGFPGHYFEHPDPQWGLPADAYVSDESLGADFWTTIAQRFGRDPGILFELWNEPVVDGEVWQTSGKDWPLLKPLWSRLLAAVREHSDAIVLVAGGCWAHDLKGVTGDPMQDARVAYAWHCYPPWEDGDPQGWLASLAGVPEIAPVIVTEWGFCRDCPHYIAGTPQSFGKPFVDRVLEPLKLHSTAWCWSPGAAPPMLQQDGATPTEYGAFVQRYLARAWRPPVAPARTACQNGGSHVD